MPMLLAATVLVFLGVAALVYAVLDLAFSDDRRVSRRLAGLTEYERVQAAQAEPLLAPFRQRVLSPTFAAVGRAARTLWPADYRDSVAKKLERAGTPHGMDVSRFVTAKSLAALGAAGLATTVTAIAGWSFGAVALAALAGGAMGLFGPDLWLSSTVDRRQHQIVRELPDMLDLLTISVEAGLGFDAALAKLVKSSRGPLAMEFGRALQEVQAGASRREALRHMAERVDVPELSSFTSAIVQADIFGISIAKVLRTQAAEMRLRRRQRAEELAQKAPVKMVIPLVLCVLPATIIVVAGPAVVKVAQLFGLV